MQASCVKLIVHQQFFCFDSVVQQAMFINTNLINNYINEQSGCNWSNQIFIEVYFILYVF